MSYIAKYRLAHDSGYHYDIAERGRNLYDKGALANKRDFRDIVISNPELGVEISCLHTNALVTINGFVHDTGMYDGKLYVLNAVPALLKTKSNQVGIIDFYDPDFSLDKRKIIPEMITKVEGFDLYQKAQVTFKEPVDGCIFILSGYLLEENDETCSRVSDRSFIISLEKLGLIDKIYELDVQYDIFEDMGIERSPNNENVVVEGSIFHDDSIMKFFTRINTFLVNIEDRYVKFETRALNPSPIPVYFRTNEEPIYPIVGGRGKLIEYKPVPGPLDTTMIFTTDAHYNNLVSSYSPPGRTTLTNNHRLMGDRYRSSSLQFLMIEVGEY